MKTFHNYKPLCIIPFLGIQSKKNTMTMKYSLKGGELIFKINRFLKTLITLRRR